jgi:archaetidylinositol phosphate synthase
MISWLCPRIPANVRPDHLTMVGVLGAVVVFGGFSLSNLNPSYLWLAAAGIVINWGGDSLDGSLARFRNCERRRYGFFVDHMTDVFSMVLIGLGGGLSPYLSMTSSLLLLSAYLMLAVMSALEAKVRGVMRISFGKVGPTEFRIFLLMLIGLLYFRPHQTIRTENLSINAYDAVLTIIAAVLLAVCAVSALRIMAELDREDPQPP